MKNFKLLLFILIVFCNSSLYALDENGNFETVEERDAYVMSILKKVAKDLNEQTPILLDQETKMMNVMVYLKTITINMQLLNYSSNEYNPFFIDHYIKEKVNSLACQNKGMQYFLNNGFKYMYVYTGRDGQFITRVLIDKYEC